MGIQGLLPLLKSIQKPVSIGADFRGQVIGVDVYCWLHKGAYGCAMELVEGKRSSMYVNYVLKRVEMLLHFNVKPILVFDGSYLPSKSGQEAQRRKIRQEHKAKGLAFLRAGNRQQAFECFQKCIDITPDMALEVIKECRKKGVDCVVAPYEADAQLAYLMKSGITQATISEDSDLLVYGCQKVIFKMDACGHGIAVDLADLSKLTSLKLHEFTQEKFRHMCILSGCDYLPSIKGVGLHKAIKLLRKSSCVYKLIRSLRLDGKMQIPADYEKKFKQADETFLYQLVFDPVTSTLAPLTQLPDGIKPGDLEFAGPLMSQEKALGIALGNINPISGEIMADFNPKRTSVFTVGVPGKVCPSAEYSGARALTPVPSSSWGHSVLSKRGKTEYDVQKNLSGLMLNSQPSANSKRPFVPPGQKRKISEDSVDDESLTSMYTSLKTRPTPTQRHAPVARGQQKKSRFKNPFRVNGQETEPTDRGENSRYFSLVRSPESESKRSLIETVKPIECSSKLEQVLMGGDNEEESDRAMGSSSGHNAVVDESSASVSAAMDTACTSHEEQKTENEHRIIESEHRPTACEMRASLSAATVSEDGTSDKEQDKENEHRIGESTLDSTDHINVQEAQSLGPRRQSLRRVARSSRDQVRPQSVLTNHSLNISGILPAKTPQTNLSDRFGYKSSLNSAKEKQGDKQKLEVIDIDSGYLSDDENSTDCGTPTPTTPLPSFSRLTPPLSEQNSGRQLVLGSTVGAKTMKNQIQLKAKTGGRSSGLGRCRSLGITRKKSKHDTSNSAASSTLFSYFEFERRKKPRLEEDQ